jgi:CBS domain-containing protein
MPQNIRDVMTSNPCTIDADKSVAYAAKMMQQEEVGLAPIVEDDKLIGMLTDRDIATRVAAQGRDPDQVKVRDVASKQLITIDPQQDLSEALRMMAKHQVRRLPVVQEDGRLVGVVAQADIARQADDQVTGRLVEEISESGGQMSSIEEGQFPMQFPRQVDDQPERFTGQEPRMEEAKEEETVSKVQAASSRGRRKRASSARKRKAGGARKTAARKSTGTRRRKTASRKRSTAKRSTAKRSTAKRGTAKRGTAKRGTAKRRATSRKRSTAKRSTAKRGTAKRRATSRKRSTAKRSTAKRSTAKRATARRRTTRRKTR